MLVLTSLLSPATFARDVHCAGRFGSETIDGNLTVSAPCRLDGTTVKGNVRVDGGSLTADRARIEGNLQARSADVVVLIETFVKGNVHLEQLVGNLSRIDLSDVGGNVHLTRNRSRLELEDSRFDGNVHVDENSGGVLILRNRIGGSLRCRRNDPAPSGSGNRVSGSSSDQCASLSPEGSAAPAPPSPPPPPSGGSSAPPPPSNPSPPPSAPAQPAPPASGGSDGSGGSGGAGSGPTQPILDPQPSGGGAAVGPLDLLVVIVLLMLLPFGRARS